MREFLEKINLRSGYLGISKVKSIDNFFGEGSFSQIEKIIQERQELHVKEGLTSKFVFYFDDFFDYDNDIVKNAAVSRMLILSLLIQAMSLLRS